MQATGAPGKCTIIMFIILIFTFEIYIDVAANNQVNI